MPAPIFIDKALEIIGFILKRTLDPDMIEKAMKVTISKNKRKALERSEKWFRKSELILDQIILLGNIKTEESDKELKKIRKDFKDDADYFFKHNN